MWTIDGLTFYVDDTILDDLDRAWVVRKNEEKGWANPPAPRTRREDRPSGPGSYRSTAYRQERIYTLAGAVWCPSPSIREHTEHTISALCSDPGRLYTLRRRTATYDQVIEVELDDEPLVEMVTMERLDWSFQFAAPDPRKHDYTWQEPVATPPTVPTNTGLDFSGAGLDFSGAGLDFGDQSVPSTAQVSNHGTAPVYPLFTLTGPLTAPTVVHVESGRTVAYAADVAPGETIVINCDDHQQRGVPGRACLSSARGNVRSLISIGTEWPRVDPQTAASFQLRAGGDQSSSVTAAIRSAWW